MMRDPITDAAQDPSCLLCLTPDRGGSWWSRLRPAMPRNFVDNPMAWTDFMAAIANATETDWSFKIKYTLNGMTGSQRIFCGGSNTGPIAIFLSSDGLMYLRTIGGSGTIIQANPASDPTGTHTVEIIAASGLYSIIYDGETVRSVQDTPTIPVLVTGDVISSQFYGTIEQAEFLCGAVVWQAAYSDLYDTSNPWPSPVPENFAENAKAFYDCQAVMREALDPTHDYSFLIEAEIVRENPECSMFYAGGDKFPFGVYVYSDNTIRVFSNLLRSASDTSSKYATIVVYSGGTRLQGRHTIELRVEGIAMHVFLDGNEITHPYTFARTGTAAVGLPNCNSGYVYKIQITDLTDNQVVWSYPAEAERVRLITKTNVRTDHGSFETADVSVISRVATQLDLRGAYVEKTFIADCWFPATSNNGTLNYFPVITQGDGLSGSGSSLVVNFSVQADYRASVASKRLQLTWADASGSIHTTNVVVTDAFFGKRHQIVGVIRPGASSTQYANELYIDGELVGRGSGSVSSFVFGNAAAASIAQGSLHVIGRDYTGFLSQSSLLYGALIFDRALSAAEIAALTPKKQPLSWAGIRDVVRRGRAHRYFTVGDVLTIPTPRWNIEYEVVGFDQVEPADAALTHSMTLLPVRLVTTVQFDAPEPGNPDANRAQYGCNRWDWSAIRQWLNSAAAPGEWWTAQHEYDAAPAYAATLAGFMADLPADFLSAVAPARLTTALPNAGGGGSVETVDRFWPPSRTEIFGALDGELSEGVQMTKYVGATDADRIKYNSAGTASGWGLRSPWRRDSHHIANVAAVGVLQELSWVSSWSGGIVPACIIA